jgi:hypothetical protein
MKNLLKVELRRMLSRRLVRGLTILALLGFTVAGVIAFVASDDSAVAVAAAEAEKRTAVQGCIADVKSGTEDFPAHATDDPAEFCEEDVWVSDPRFTFREMKWVLTSLGVPLMMLGWLVGASFMGAEWHNRTITTTLTWEARRGRALAAKLLIAGAVAFGWVLLLQVVFTVAMYPAGEFEGTMAGIDAEWVGEYSGIVLRSAALAGIASVVGMSIATVGRNTAAALGVGFVYLAVVEGLIRGFRPQWVDWLIGDNAALFLAGPGDVTHVGHSQLTAGLLLLAYTAALALGATAVFRAREVA